MTGVYDPSLPEARGLFDPALERNSCGVGFVANVKNRKSHEIVQQGLQILLNLDHRGAVGADPKLGDGCGILVQMPHAFFAKECGSSASRCPRPASTASASSSCPATRAPAREIEKIVGRVLEEEGLTLLGWRDTPVDNSDLGEAVKAVEPVMRQAFIGRGPGVTDEDDFERRLYVARKAVSNAIYALRPPRDRRILSRFDVVPHHRLQGHGARLAARLLLQGSGRPHASRARWRSCTSASRRTRSRRGGWPIPIAWSPTTARSTRCAATSTGWRRARPPSSRSCSATTSPSSGRSPTRASRTPRASTTRSNSSCRAATRSPTR